MFLVTATHRLELSFPSCKKCAKHNVPQIVFSVLRNALNMSCKTLSTCSFSLWRCRFVPAKCHTTCRVFFVTRLTCYFFSAKRRQHAISSSQYTLGMKFLLMENAFNMSFLTAIRLEHALSYLQKMYKTCP